VKSPVFLVANKVDKLAQKDRLLNWLPMVLNKYPFTEVFPLSATKGTNLAELKQALKRAMPEQAWVYEEDEITDQSTRFICGELIREQLMTYLHQELPYSTAVEVESFVEKSPTLTEIQAVIWVSRDSQKGIIIGKQGETLKRIGSSARIALENFLETKVMLKLWVRVEENWENSPRHLQSLGISS
jgi:GTP-binding protein Era